MQSSVFYGLLYNAKQGLNNAKSLRMPEQSLGCGLYSLAGEDYSAMIPAIEPGLPNPFILSNHMSLSPPYGPPNLSKKLVSVLKKIKWPPVRGPIGSWHRQGQM